MLLRPSPLYVAQAVTLKLQEKRNYLHCKTWRSDSPSVQFAGAAKRAEAFLHVDYEAIGGDGGCHLGQGARSRGGGGEGGGGRGEGGGGRVKDWI